MPPKKPLISVVTASLNQGKFIEQNIESILEQDYKKVEHIIVDGGSTDNTLKLLKKYKHLNWVSEKDNGQSEALNKGFKKAKGEIIGWLNSDDYYEKSVFKKIVSVFTGNPEIKIVFGDCNYVNENGEIIKTEKGNFVSFDDWYRFWNKKSIIAQPTLFFRKQLLQELGYLDESLHYSMDFDLFCRFFRKHAPKYLPITIANFRLHEKSKTLKESLSGFNNNFIAEGTKVSKKYWKLPDIFSFHAYYFFGNIRFRLAELARF